MSIEHLTALDPIFAECLRVGGPALRDFRRQPGFAGLLRIIQEQQLATRVAETLWDALCARIGPPTPDGILAADDAVLKGCGFSRQKIGYARGLARAVADGTLDFDALHGLDDDAAVAALTALKGIGRWSAEVYLMGAMNRPDIWPADDLAIRLGVQALKGWAQRPDRAALVAAAEPWRPHRSLAARLVWHHYVAVRQERLAPDRRQR